METKTLTLRDIEELATDALFEHGLFAKGWRFSWDSAKVRAGACKYRTKQITLSKPIFTIEANRDDVLDVILHEIAHALVGPGVGHGFQWKAMARKIGARPERCHSLETAGTVIATCANCGPVGKMTRMPKATYHCRRCRIAVTWKKSA